MNKKLLRKIALIAVMAAIVIGIIVIILLSSRNPEEKHVTVGIILTGNKDEQGWNGRHYDGIAYACEKSGSKLLVKENVPEEKDSCLKAATELMNDGAEMIILGSYGYQSNLENNLDKFPEISFFSITSENVLPNIPLVFGRMYEARYLCGIIAGMTTKTNHIGYVAAMNNSEVNRGINAFTLGVRSVNKVADVNVIWTNSWNDEEKETKAAEKLIKEADADVLAYHQNMDYVVKTAEKYGKYSIGYNEKPQNTSEKCLTSAVWDWSSLYSEIIKEYLQGEKHKQSYYWYGIEKGVVGLTELSSEVSESAAKEMDKAYNELLGGKNIFSGEIRDVNGVLICESGETLSDIAILNKIDWFVEGVKFYE